MRVVSEDSTEGWCRNCERKRASDLVQNTDGRIGVAPEKSIKLVVNGYVRGKATDPETGRISVPMELVAGGTAGACQVVSTGKLA